jgi:hypothetical protein
MPTAKPRIAVTLNQHTFDVIARMAQLQGCSRGSVVAELLDSVAPALTRTVALLEAAADAPKQVRDGLRTAVESTHDDLVEIAGGALKQMDWLLGELSGGGVNPHVVTRGSGLTDTPPSKASKPKRKPATTRAAGKSATPKGTGVKDAGKKREI